MSVYVVRKGDATSIGGGFLDEILVEAECAYDAENFGYYPPGS